MDTSIPIQVSATCCKSKQILSSPEYLLVLALTDGIALHGRDSEEIHAGTLLFLSPFSERKLWLEPGSRVIYGILPASFLEPLVGIPQRASIVLLQDSADTAREKLIELFDQSYNNPTSALQRLCTAYELLQALEPIITNHVTVQSAPASANQRAAEMIEYLEAHFREPISLGDLAEAFSVSRQYISTVFHRELGVTFSEYLLKLRLEEALRLLLTTNQNVTTISESSGFPNLRSFNLAFQTAHGITPKEFRKKRENAEEETNRKPTGVVLRDINQLLRPYRLVYQKNEAAIRFSDVIEAGRGTSFGQNWNILNVDNSLDCLQRTVQDSLTHIQEEMHFQYIRLGNVTTATMIPFHPSTKKHLFSNFGLLIDFVRGLGLSPMLAMGNNYEVMMDTLVVDKHSYFTSIAHWQDFLKELLDFSIQRWGVEWVSTWRFEFFFPETMYEEQPQEEFLALFEQSLTLIHQLAPDAQVGGPALPVDSVHRPRWKTWFEGLFSRDIKPDFISMEIWANHAWKIETFRGLYGEMREFYSIGDMYSADAALAVQKAEEILASMAQYGYAGTPLYVSALGVTKYQAAAAQIGGHCAAHLIKCNLELNDLVQGIGCWKALNNESEYLEENQIVGNGCGLIGRFDLKNINWYAQIFLTGLMPYRLFQGLNYIVTTDRCGGFSILLHNSKNYSPYFCKHYHDGRTLDFTDQRLYESDEALEQTILLSGVAHKDYWVDQHLIGNYHGCIGVVLKQMGTIRQFGEHEIGYLAGQSLPYQHTYRMTADHGLRFSITLQPNEVMLLKIIPCA